MGLDDQQLKMLADLKRKRAVIKASLTRVRTFVSKFISSEQPISLLEFRQEELPQINRKFDDIQSEIELFAVDDTEGAETERGNFEEEYFAIRSHIQEIINSEKAPSTTLQNASFGATSFLNRTQLAPIPLPKFNGNIQDWSSFFDIFQAMVHNDGSYSDAQKFFYLRSCLEGSALDLVRSINVSDGNYEVVIQRLKQRYDNQSLVIQAHIRSILDCPRIEDSSPSQSLKELYSCVCTHVAALKALHQPVEHWDAWLVTIIVSRLDRNTASGWQLQQRNTELPKYKDLEAFLANRCVALENTDYHTYETGGANNSTSSKRSNLKKSGRYTNMKEVLIAAEAKSANPCFCCTEMHRLHACNKFKELSVKERLNIVRESRLCFNCLAPFHSADNCRSKFSCQKCSKKHNTLLHFEKATGSTAVINVPFRSNDNTACTSKEDLENHLALSAHGGEGHVFLATASVLVEDRHGQFRKCRAILDSGSQINFVSSKLAGLLQLPRKKVLLPVSGIGANHVRSISSVSLKLKSRVTSFEVDLVCHVLPIVMDDLPRCSKPIHGWNIPDELISQLADPEFNDSGRVDLLIGGGIFFELLESTRIQLQNRTLCLQGTKLGWVVAGEIGTKSCFLSVSCAGQIYEEHFRALCKNEYNMFGSTSKSNNRCIEEQKALKHFEETTKRDETGRFVLRLPLKPEVYELGATLDMATSRFLSVERRLQRNKELRLQYTQFMDEYLKMGHMEKVHKESNQSTKCIYYLPHHPVLKLSSLTTKLRVVFDASAKSSSKLSLNDVLMCGPTVQDDLFAILMRFRKHQFVITADIEKMFRQIKVDPEDQDLQRIVWRSSPDKALESYRLTTVTYGTTSASFMATNCLITLSEETKESHPEVSKIIRRDFYMDDLMTGANTVNECCQIQQQINTILESAKLPLRKWCSNSPEVLKYIGKSNSDPLFALQIGVDDIIKSLGLSWKPELDEFRFMVEYNATKIKATKRMFLSDLNRIFDPLGFLAPVLVRGKIFLQQLWQLKFEWDKPLPENLKIRWDNFYKELKHLSSLSIPRKCIPSVSVEVEIHGFCDASEEAFGAAIYVRSKDEMGNWNSRLLCAKTRVAPLKGSTIPRLELCGALTLAHLAKKTAEAWEYRKEEIHLWSDSMVVLGWINSQSCRLKTYVSNRIEQILEISERQQWRYIKTDENPADVLSRGTAPKELQNNKLWWNGPHWLLEDSDSWKESSVLIEEEKLPEQRQVKLTLLIISPFNELFAHYSNWRRLISAVAWIKRFVNFIRTKKNLKLPQYLTVPELKSAEICVLQRVQEDTFKTDILALANGDELPRSSKLKRLAPFLDRGLLYVGGRLQNAKIPERQKHPIVLPAKHKVTKLIFEDRHRELLHCGSQALLAEVRRLYWPLKGRLIARSVILKCVRCIKAKPRFVAPQMGQLPRQRVQCSRPFSITGVDFAGPLIIRSGLRRVPGIKAWISLFVCFTTRAVHLEVVEDLTSNAFVAALRRFMSRRGRCAKIYSDNGTNFVGAQKELNFLISSNIPIMAKEGIEWHFNPPLAPHFGGLWESAVKSAKHHLTRMLGENKLTLGELNTLLCQIEACLNSRPMTPLDSDPAELEALTPAHFLIGGALTLPEEIDLTQEKIGPIRRWRYVQFLTQTFWRRWQAEYLPQYQLRGKWTTNRRSIKIDDVVIIRDECTAPTKWKLGKVIQLHPGNDGIVRVVTLRIASGAELKRPVVKLCILPTEKDQEIVETL